ncbi:MAG TPA: hypothetical protein VN704_09485 [Verrucomicrobiae bacterium]|nr:hypothetical protein [Verrucomicrobiae bacterium]
MFSWIVISPNDNETLSFLILEQTFSNDSNNNRKYSVSLVEGDN